MERKIEVLLFQEHHCIQLLYPDTCLLVYRPPILQEMANYWQFARETIWSVAGKLSLSLKLKPDRHT